MTFTARLQIETGKYFPCILVLLATACSIHASKGPDGSPAMDVLTVSPPDYHGTPGHPLGETCRNWALSAQQVEQFFRLSDGYTEAPYSRFYQVGRGISGELYADGQRWTFTINGGGMAAWQAGERIRHFGCSAPECDSLLLLPGDGMAPDLE